MSFPLVQRTGGSSVWAEAPFEDHPRRQYTRRNEGGGEVKLESGQRVHIPGKNLPDWVTIDEAIPNDGGWKLYVRDDEGVIHKADLLASEAESVTVLSSDGAAASPRVLAGLWTQWMAAAGANANATLLASVPLRPYAHQSNAVYGAMLTQPKRRSWMWIGFETTKAASCRGATGVPLNRQRNRAGIALRYHERLHAWQTDSRCRNFSMALHSGVTDQNGQLTSTMRTTCDGTRKTHKDSSVWPGGDHSSRPSKTGSLHDRKRMWRLPTGSHSLREH